MGKVGWGWGGSSSCKLQQPLRICDTMQCRNLDGLPVTLSLQAGIRPFPHDPRDPGTPPKRHLWPSPPAWKTQAAEGFTSRNPRPHKKLYKLDRQGHLFTCMLFLLRDIKTYILNATLRPQNPSAGWCVCVRVGVSVYLHLWTHVSCLNRWFNHISFSFPARWDQIRSANSSRADVQY